MYAINHVPTIDMSRSTTGCCARFEPSKWDEQTFVFEEKPFLRVTTNSFLYMPLNMGHVMKTAQAKIDEAGAYVDEPITLSHDLSPWKAEHYLAVSGAVPGVPIEHLSGTFLAKVFEGPYKNMGQWLTEITEYAKTRGMEPVMTYFYYTTCPKCSKAYGENYVVAFQQVKET